MELNDDKKLYMYTDELVVVQDGEEKSFDEFVKEKLADLTVEEILELSNKKIESRDK